MKTVTLTQAIVRELLAECGRQSETQQLIIHGEDCQMLARLYGVIVGLLLVLLFFASRAHADELPLVVELGELNSKMTMQPSTRPMKPTFQKTGGRRELASV